MYVLYYALLSFAVTLHVSVKSPTSLHPEHYDLNTCSGVFIAPDEILTAAHCVKHSRGSQWIKTSAGDSYPVAIEKVDEFKDLALLKVKKPINHAYAQIGTPSDIADRVYTVNSGNDYEKTFNTGIVNNLIIDDEFNTASILHNAAIMPGASGSGLFNSEGELVGINVAIMRGFSEAVDLQEIKAFLLLR